MIIKPLEEPIKIQKLEVLKKRLFPTHVKMKEIEKELAKNIAGYKGEKSLLYYLSFLPEEEYMILHDLRLTLDNRNYFQIDILILSQYFILILEVKNISGKITFDETFHQLIRQINDVEEVFPDPVLQVNHQKYQLIRYLKKNKIANIPIEAHVVMTNNSALLQNQNNCRKYLDTIMRSSELITKVEYYKQKYKAPIFTMKDLRKLAKSLLKDHTHSEYDVIHMFELDPNEICKGVFCTKCDCYPLQRKRGTWYCSVCSFSSKTAHLDALNDYKLLFGTTITNKQTRDFLQITSPSTTYKILTSMKLPQIGHGKSTSYNLLKRNI
ncbi:hypothetical protein JOC75_002504 [Metabacillus crassostreae]|uniref:nuclease-related domain-containing protein n=1 Tax=Metabacillus crassostreae TaxID=929098 RepID=UPI00195AB170|nr:nuclease-related domain-containing protein [Metabacillus crassostreae]MBM7604501.1 hypothetical protein [Metabacillus crassostreae]